MTNERSQLSLQTVITQLYQNADIPFPTSQRCIVPLSALVDNYNLTYTEISDLSQQSAMHYLLEQGGIIELPEDMKKDPLAGFLYANTHFGSIFIEREDMLVRRRFSVAHELGHYLLHFRPLLDMAERDNEYIEITEALQPFGGENELQNETTGQVTIPRAIVQSSRLPNIQSMEQEADQFAAELLMPTEIIRGLFARHMINLKDEDLITRLATEMLVSRESMRWRLHNLGFQSNKKQ